MHIQLDLDGKLVDTNASRYENTKRPGPELLSGGYPNYRNIAAPEIRLLRLIKPKSSGSGKPAFPEPVQNMRNILN
jgi:hypothetical protein